MVEKRVSMRGNGIADGVGGQLRQLPHTFISKFGH